MARIAPGNQLHAGLVLERLSLGLGRNEMRLGVTGQDIALPFLDYVYGEAQIGGQTAVVSSFRLKTAHDKYPLSESKMYERIAKVALHETGHLLGFSHCRNERCIMSFSIGLSRLDSLQLALCSNCRTLLSRL